jgi:short subunit dehydrogenase-like uncharacterized protein
MTDSSRNYDLILFGATGFTGMLTAEYLAAKQEKTPFRMAIAGRNSNKLSELKADILKQYPSAEIGIIEADSDNYESLKKMTAQAQVVLTTVGPYAKFGEPLVEACIATKTDYADITGESNFVNDIIKKHGDEAEKQKVRIVNCCGFDSIPADFGAYYTMKQFESKDIKVLTIKGYAQFNSKGWNPLSSISGGTWHSAINLMRIPELFRQRGAMSRIEKQAKSKDRKISHLFPQVHYLGKEKAWGVPLPLVDNEIVLRSASGIQDYGQAFYYGHHGQLNSIVSLATGAVGVSSLMAFAQVKFTRDMLLSLRPSGAGPDQDQRQKNSFQLRFHAKSELGEMITQVSGGDPGYSETSKMLSETALCLALDRADLPERFGILTPVLAGQDLLLNRLQKAGIRFETLEKSFE